MLSKVRNIKDKELVINILSSVVVKGLGVLLSFIIVPLYMKYLDQNMYGFWLLILSIISWINTFDIGLGNSLKNSIAMNLPHEKYHDIKKDISSAFLGVSIIAFLFLIIIKVLILVFPVADIFGITSINGERVEEILWINSIFLLVNFIASLGNSIFMGMQKAYLSSISTLLFQILNITGMLIFLRSNSNQIMMISIIYGLSLFISLCIVMVYFFYKNIKIIPTFSNISIKSTLHLMNVGGKMFVMQLTGLLMFSMGNFIISKYVGLSEVAEYNVVIKIFSIFSVASSIILAPLWPAVTRAFSSNDINWLMSIMKKMKLFSLITFLSIILMTVFGKHIIEIWTLGKISPKFSTICLAGVYTFLTCYTSQYLTILLGLGMLALPMKISVIQSIVNIIFLIYLIKIVNYGVNGAFIATSLSLLIGSILFPKYLMKQLKLMNKMR